MRRRLLVLAAALPVLLVGCSGTNHHSSDPTTSLGGRTAGAPNPDVVPAVITPAYVNAVFAVLNHINGNAVRAALAANAITPAVSNDLRAIFGDPLYSEELKIVDETLAGETTNFRKPPGDIKTTVKSLISASRGCVFVATTSDFSSVVQRPGPLAGAEYWVLRPKPTGIDPLHLNPTPWAMSFNATYATPTSIPDQCSAS